MPKFDIDEAVALLKPLVAKEYRVYSHWYTPGLKQKLTEFGKLCREHSYPLGRAALMVGVSNSYLNKLVNPIPLCPAGPRRRARPLQGPTPSSPASESPPELEADLPVPPEPNPPQEVTQEPSHKHGANLRRNAELCIAISRKMCPEASLDDLHKQSIALLALSEEDIEATCKRLGIEYNTPPIVKYNATPKNGFVAFAPNGMRFEGLSFADMLELWKVMPR